MKTFETKMAGQDGTAFYVQGWEPDAGKPKALVALIHGLGEHTGRYPHVEQALTEAGYALAGFDLRGHGKSGGARGHTSSLDAYMQDIKQFLALLKQRYPDVPHFLYGHSLGGLLTLTYTIQHGAGLKGVMVTSSALRSPLQKQKAKVMLAKILGSLVPTVTLPSGLEAAAISHDPDVVQKYIHDPLVHSSTSLGFGKAALKAVDLCFTRAREFPVPLLLMHGAGDRIAYSSGSEEFAGLVRAAGGDVTLKLWKDMYHELHNEPEKADVFKFMIAWLDTHL
jgi:alpha-beta hydrolase superfamily lysophospholipase